MEKQIVYILSTELGDRFYCGESKKETASVIFAEKYITRQGAEFVRREILHPHNRERFSKILPVRISVEILEESSEE